MFPYYLVFFLLTLFYLLVCGISRLSLPQRKNLFSMIALVLLCCFVGLRDWNVGIDTMQYAYHFDIVSYTASHGMEMTEWGFFKFMFFIRYWMGWNFQTLLFLLGTLNIFSLIYNLRRYSTNIYLGIIIYLTLGLFTMNLSGMRQSFAIALCFLSVPLIEQRRLIPFLLLIGAAFTIHNSAVVFLPVYFLWGIRINRFQGLALLIVTLLAFVYRLYLNPIIEWLAPARYASIDLLSSFDINILVILVPLVLTIFSLCFLPLKDKHKFSKIDSYFYIFSCLYIGGLILSINNNQIGRLSYYFALGNMICFPAALTELFNRSRFIAIFVGLCATVLFFLYFFISTPGGTLKIDNYQLFFM